VLVGCVDKGGTVGATPKGSRENFWDTDCPWNLPEILTYLWWGERVAKDVKYALSTWLENQ